MTLSTPLLTRLLTASLWLFPLSVCAEPATRGTDYRTLAEMPAQARELMRVDMLDHLAALNEIIGLLGSGELEQLAEVAEQRMGKSSMGKHRASGMGPGRFMPQGMRQIGWSMHEAASRLAETAKQGDLQGSYQALQGVTSACVACHQAYRSR